MCEYRGNIEDPSVQNVIQRLEASRVEVDSLRRSASPPSGVPEAKEKMAVRDQQNCPVNLLETIMASQPLRMAGTHMDPKAQAS